MSTGEAVDVATDTEGPAACHVTSAALPGPSTRTDEVEIDVGTEIPAHRDLEIARQDHHVRFRLVEALEPAIVFDDEPQIVAPDPIDLELSGGALSHRDIGGGEEHR